jgi:hypothetical protein
MIEILHKIINRFRDFKLEIPIKKYMNVKKNIRTAKKEYAICI